MAGRLELGERLAGRVALITGAGSGIGRAVAIRLVAEGARVVVNDLREDACDAVVAELRETGAQAASAPGDVADGESADAIVEAARVAFGGLDILVNNAGITRDGPLHRMPDHDWRLVQDVILGGAFHMCRAAAPLLRGTRDERPDHHRKVVNMGSSVGLYGAPGTVNYAAAKAGLIGLTRSLSREWAGARVNVNAVAPGLIAGTRLTDGKPQDLIAQVAARVPIGRAGTPEDVAAAVAYLASSDADFMTGHVLELHGGLEVM